MGEITPFEVQSGKKRSIQMYEAQPVVNANQLEDIKRHREEILAKRPKVAGRRVKLDASYVDDGDKYLFDKRMKKRKDVVDPDDYVEFSVNYRLPGFVYDQLFDYQRTGVKWMYELHCQEAGGIIADEMVSAAA